MRSRNVKIWQLSGNIEPVRQAIEGSYPSDPLHGVALDYPLQPFYTEIFTIISIKVKLFILSTKTIASVDGVSLDNIWIWLVNMESHI